MNMIRFIQCVYAAWVADEVRASMDHVLIV